MNISVEIADPRLNDVRPHYCTARGLLIGLRFESDEYVREVFCPWCGAAVPAREPGHDYARTVRPERFDGPLCEHGYPDATCLDLYDSDEKASWDLVCGAVREFRAALLARRYGCAPAVESWVRPCPECRKTIAMQRAPLLRYELGRIGSAVMTDSRKLSRHANDMRDDVRKLHEAFLELDDLQAACASEPERRGFVYLIGHSRAVKIGWSDRHPAAPGGRLAELQTASPDDLELLGLIESPFRRERHIQTLFAKFRLRGEWFVRHEQILEYFFENGIAP